MAVAAGFPAGAPGRGPPWDELCSDQLHVGQWRPSLFVPLSLILFHFIMLPELVVIPFIFRKVSSLLPSLEGFHQRRERQMDF